jgi:hypothetical protein
MNRKIQYILDTFTMCYQIDSLPEIGYGTDMPGQIVIKKSTPDSLFDDQFRIDPQKVIWKEWKGKRVPFLFDNEDQEIITPKDIRIFINYDILASAFYLLSGFQELDKSKRDSLGRFNYTESIQYKLDIVGIPVVNYYFDILKTAIETALHITVEPKFSTDRGFTACLTHDIDNCENAWIEGSYDAIKKGLFFTPFHLLFHKFVLGRDKWFNFKDIHFIEKEYGATSSFYFLCKKGKYMGKNNADYDIADRKFDSVMDDIESIGSEVGIHGSFGTHVDAELLAEDIRKVRRPVYGGRFHFLEFEIERTPKILDEAGLTYDSTLGFAEHPGFRNSFCYPFYLYNFEKDCPTRVLEIPLILMDSSLQSRSYLHVSPLQAREMVDSLTEEIRKFNGIFTILWHSTLFSDYKYKGWKDVYIYFLNKCRQYNAGMIHAKAVADILKRNE